MATGKVNLNKILDRLNTALTKKNTTQDLIVEELNTKLDEAQSEIASVTIVNLRDRIIALETA